HEANKIKLHGLHREHSKLVKIINDIRKIVQFGLQLKSNDGNGGKPILIPGIDVQISSLSSVRPLVEKVVEMNKPNINVAGHTADFVNHILDNVSSGITGGGLDSV